MDTRSFNYFLAVADTGSVSSAAQACFVTQPAVSRQIAALEREVGLKLFRRTATGMQLTPAGTRLRAMAKDIQVRTERTRQVMTALHQERPAFTVACPETTGNFFIAPYIASGAPITDIIPVRPAAVYDRLTEGVDLAVNTSRPPAHLVSRRLLACGILVQDLNPDQFEDVPGQGVELSALAGRPLLMPGFGSAIERTVLDAAEEAGLPLNTAKTTSNGTLAQALAAAGQGSALVIEHPQFGLKNSPLFHNGKPLMVTLYAAWEPDHYATEELAALAKKLGEWMRRHWHETSIEAAG